jgi:hypothetical protein
MESFIIQDNCFRYPSNIFPLFGLLFLVDKYKSENYRDLPIQKRLQRLTETASLLKIWCRRPDLNRHGRGPLPPQDSVSTKFHHFGTLVHIAKQKNVSPTSEPAGIPAPAGTAAQAEIAGLAVSRCLRLPAVRLAPAGPDSQWGPGCCPRRMPLGCDAWRGKPAPVK